MFKSFFKKSPTYEQFDHTKESTSNKLTEFPKYEQFDRTKESTSNKLTEFPKYEPCCFGLFKKQRELTDAELEAIAKESVSNESTPLLKS